MGRSQYYNGDWRCGFHIHLYSQTLHTSFPNSHRSTAMAGNMPKIGLMFEAETTPGEGKARPTSTSAAPQQPVHYTCRLLYAYPGSYADAVPYIKNALKGSSKLQKTRPTSCWDRFIPETGRKALALEAFKRAGSSSSQLPYKIQCKDIPAKYTPTGHRTRIEGKGLKRW